MEVKCMNLIVSKARKGLDFHIDPISIELETDTITELDPEELSDQLEAMGLSCPHTKGKLLERNIQDVLSRIETGPLETFGVYRDYGPLSNDQLAGLGISPSGTAFNEELLQSVLQKQFERKANGNWAENNLGKFTYKLFVLQNKDNFEYLKKNCDDFPFTENSKTNIGKVTTVQAIKDLFTDTTSVCTAATVDGINEESLKAIFSNALETLDTSVLENDYEQSDNRVITLLLNYDPNNKTCDGVGILTCEWTIKIKTC